MVVFGRQPGEDFIKQSLILAHERPLDLAFGGVAKRIERGAAKELELRENAEDWEYQRPECHLTGHAGDLVPARQQRRREMDMVAQMFTAEIVVDLPLERGIGVEPSHLVFVLVGHELEKIARNSVGKPGF